jgi:hypothetical protein
MVASSDSVMNIQEMLVTIHQVLVKKGREVPFVIKQLYCDAGQERNKIANGHHE